MTMTRLLSLTGAAALTLTFGAPGALADQAPYPVGTLCESGADCAGGEVCLYGTCQTAEECASNADCWSGWCGSEGVCTEAPACTTDAECGDGNICDYGYCGPKGRSCLSDADCGAMARCEFSEPPQIEVSEGSGSASSGSSGSEGSDGGAAPDNGAPMPPREDQEIPVEPPVGITRGECVLDVEAVPTDATCEALCEAIAACSLSTRGAEPTPGEATEPSPGASDSASPEADAGFAPDREPAEAYEPSEPTAEEIAEFATACTAFCSYGVATQTAGYEGLGAALACVEAQASCDAIDAACEDEGAPVGEMFDALEDRVAVDFGASDTATGGVNETGNLEDGTPKGDQVGATPTDGGCQGGAGSSLAALAGLLFVALARRRALQG